MTTRRQKRLAYRIARQAWLDAKGDSELAEYKARNALNDVSLPPFVIELLAAIIVKLIIKWMTDRTAMPEEMPLDLIGDDEGDE